jgi:hypothetical protein
VQLQLITTMAHYESLDVPLGRFERAYVATVIEGPGRSRAAVD